MIKLFWNWLLLVFVVSSLSSLPAALAVDQCAEDEQCGDGGSCAMGYCAATECMNRELENFNSQFNSRQYVDGLLAEAGVSKQQILEARRDTMGDDNAFSQSPPVRRFMEVIHAHSEELNRVADIIYACKHGQGIRTNELVLSEESTSSSSGAVQAVVDATTGEELDVAGEGAQPRAVGLIAGYLMAAITNMLMALGGVDPNEPESEDWMSEDSGSVPEQAASPSVSLVPSASPSAKPSGSPSISPSAAPSYSVSEKVYLGFHIEGGIVFDGSYSLLSPQDRTTNIPGQLNQYSRACIGAEIGGGGELSLIILTANLRENGDITGSSVLTEYLEGYVGIGVGFGVGVTVEGPAVRDGNDPVHYEVTIGAGLGFALVGVSLCRTNVCDPLS